MKYNPFKMWGSWLGAGIGIVISLFSTTSATYGDGITHIPLYDFINIYFVALVNNTTNLVPDIYWHILYRTSLVAFGIIIVGFLTGWGINSLIRRFK